MKTCFKCGIVKSLDEFYAHPAMTDGRLGKCKKCTMADALANRLKNIDRVREYDRQRAKAPDRKAKGVAINKAWRAADKRRPQAHRAVAYAIKCGRLEKAPCVRCGSIKSLAHHEDYDKPLDVVWLCQPCHKARHKEIDLEVANTLE